MSLIIPEISKEELLKQTIEKFKRFLVNDLKIDEEQLNSNEGMLEKIKIINQCKQFISLVGKERVLDYVQNIIINFFKLKEINQDQKEKLNEFLELFTELIE